MLLDMPSEIQAECAAGLFTQTDIRDFNTILLRDGKEALFEQARTVKDKKIKGHKNVTADTKKKEKNAKRIRKKGDILELMEYIQQDSGMGNGIWTRMLAWCAGEIDDNEMYMSLKQHANEHELTFRIPAYVGQAG
jgi:hypothetical protein